MPLSLQDKFEIQELLARFIQVTDLGDYEEMRDLFVADSRFVIAKMGMDIAGIDSIVPSLKDLRATLPMDVFHVLSNFVVDGDGDEATVRCASQALQAGEDRVKHMAFGYYTDQVVRTADGWRLKEHNLALLA